MGSVRRSLFLDDRVPEEAALLADVDWLPPRRRAEVLRRLVLAGHRAEKEGAGSAGVIPQPARSGGGGGAVVPVVPFPAQPTEVVESPPAGLGGLRRMLGIDEDE